MHIIILLVTAAAAFFTSHAYAKDSREISEERRKFYTGTSFYCEIGRNPSALSSDAWTITTADGCRFSGPLDTKINRLILEAPILNPLLKLPDFEKLLLQSKLRFDKTSSGEIKFLLPSGESLSASVVKNRDMTDTLFHLNAYPKTWGGEFLRISSSTPFIADAFVRWAKADSLASETLFWKNPHFQTEENVLPILKSARSYAPIELVSKCENGSEWKRFGSGARSLLIVGDMHSGAETEFLFTMLNERSFSWAGLEITRDREKPLRDFLDATDSQAEENALQLVLNRASSTTMVAAKNVLRSLKASHTPIVLIDYSESYFNFPYTSTSFHGLILGTRNRLWAERLPDTWTGAGVLLAGLDHFTVTSGADFQNFLWQRFPGLETGLIVPKEICPSP